MTNSTIGGSLGNLFPLARFLTGAYASHVSRYLSLKIRPVPTAGGARRAARADISGALPEPCGALWESLNQYSKAVPATPAAIPAHAHAR
jgi:hypothetical protein